jgi:hypothetical protein
LLHTHRQAHSGKLNKKELVRVHLKGEFKDEQQRNIKCEYYFLENIKVNADLDPKFSKNVLEM